MRISPKDSVERPEGVIIIISPFKVESCLWWISLSYTMVSPMDVDGKGGQLRLYKGIGILTVF